MFFGYNSFLYNVKKKKFADFNSCIYNKDKIYTKIYSRKDNNYIRVKDKIYLIN